MSTPQHPRLRPPAVLAPYIQSWGKFGAGGKEGDHGDRVLAGPFKADWTQPPFIEGGICPANSTLFEQQYKRQPSCGISAGEGSPVRTSSTVLRASGGSPDS